MSMRINPPTFGDNYERYKQELLAWREVTDLAKEKRGIAIALTLPENHPCKLREKVFDEIDLKELKAEKGLDVLIAFLDTHLKVDDLSDCFDKYEHFEECKRVEGQSMNDFIAEYDMRNNKIVKKKIILPQEVLAFRLLKCANITREERLLVLTGVDYTQKDTLYEQAKASLKKFKGQQLGSSCVSGDSVPIKLEPAFLAQNEEALLSAGYIKKKQWRNPSFKGDYSQPQRRGRESGVIPKTNRERRVNPDGPDGKPLTCRACGSYRHLLRDCPDSWENMSKVNVTESDEHVVLFTGYNKQEVTQLGVEAGNCAVLDSACTSNVCGEDWMENYVASLDSRDRATVIHHTGSRVFKFGGGTTLKSVGEYDIPATIVGKPVRIKTDVVQSHIPLLLSKNAMKKAEVKLDIANDSAEIFGEDVTLNITTSGHYCIPLNKEVPVESIYAVKLAELTDDERHKTILKLHRQFAHPPEKRLIALMKDADVWSDDYRDIVTDVQAKCDVCKMYAKTPARPVVAMPMAKKFNEKVAMDLKKWGDRWILYLIDMWSRLTISVFIDRKRPQDVIEKIMTHWIGAGYGVMGAVMTDNGGEFHADEMREIASILNVEVCTSAAYSPFQNGLCERGHAVTDMMLHKLVAECPNTPVEVLLCWANMARNSLQMWNGFSSHQLVFGQNPNLPNIMTDKIPALEGSTSSEILAEHLNALHQARRAFIQSEAEERIRRALRSKVRASEQTFHNGDRVFYKHEGKERWLGPGKVVFQDGKVVFVRHGGSFVRVSPNRLIKANIDVDDTVVEDKEPGVIDKEYKAEVEQVFEKVDTLDSLEGGQPHMKVHTDTSESAENGDTVSAGIEEPADNVGEQKETENAVPADAEPAVKPKTREKIILRQNDVIRYQEENSGEWKPVVVLGRAGKASGPKCNWYNVRHSDEAENCVNLDRVQWEKLDQQENHVYMTIVPRKEHDSQECNAAKQVELEKLKQFGTYEEVKDNCQTRVSTRWILWYKGSEVRARLVARGFEEETNSPRDSPTVGKSAVRMLLAIAASKGWRVKTTDIKSAFLQSRQLDREVYIKPPPEADVLPGRIWRLLKCLYGLNDAARQFYNSVVDELNLLGCIQATLDPALFYKFDSSGELVGLLVSHIDDFLHAGEGVFDTEVMAGLRNRFLAGKLEEDHFTYIGFTVKRDKLGILLDQNKYVEDIHLENISPGRSAQKCDNLNERERTQYRSIAGCINWVVRGTRPDAAFEFLDISTKFNRAKVEDLVQAVKVVKKIKGENSAILFPDLGIVQGWRILIFTDAAHANLCDGVSSSMAFVVFLMGEKGCCPLSWRANKIHRVVRSTLAAEALSLQEGIEEAVYIKSMLQEVLGNAKTELPIVAYVDNKSVVEAIYSTKMVDDRRLRIDIAAIKQYLVRREVDAVRWVPGDDQLANCLTKKGASGKQLLCIFQTGKMSLDV